MCSCMRRPVPRRGLQLEPQLCCRRCSSELLSCLFCCPKNVSSKPFSELHLGAALPEQWQWKQIRRELDAVGSFGVAASVAAPGQWSHLVKKCFVLFRLERNPFRSLPSTLSPLPCIELGQRAGEICRSHLAEIPVSAKSPLSIRPNMSWCSQEYLMTSLASFKLKLQFPLVQLSRYARL